LAGAYFFYIYLLRLAATDPLPHQVMDDAQPPSRLVADTNEYGVKAILKERRKRRGRGWVRELLVKWEGYARPTWEPANALEETEALDLIVRQDLH
jgi:hypothetical protein